MKEQSVRVTKAYFLVLENVLKREGRFYTPLNENEQNEREIIQ